MKLKKVDALPKRRAGRGENVKLVQEFIASGCKVAEVELDDGRNPVCVTNALRKLIKLRKMPARVAMRAGKIYLMRADA